ncbi:MAG: YvcK family protein [Bacillales bacterium]|jgi:uncharacterized cofD-like protein|nr:YvcK family protein [Bacillales bacterium]
MNNSKPKIVVLGGGTGLSVILRGLKKYSVDITAIVTVADDGGSTGRLREELGIPAVGDIRNVIGALSDVEPLLEQLFEYRFADSEAPGVAGHSLGNLLLAAMTDLTGDFAHGVREMGKVLNVKGRVFPNVAGNVVLNAELEDGTIVTGESKIPKSGKKIKRVFLTPESVQPVKRVKNSILEADLILVGPGSLYTSILANLVTPTFKDLIEKSRAKKVYICNMMTQHGETQGYSATDHVQAIVDHMGTKCIDTILINNKDIPCELKLKYLEEEAEPVILDIEKLKDMGLDVIQEEIVTIQNGVIRHDAEKIATILVELIQK